MDFQSLRRLCVHRAWGRRVVSSLLLLVCAAAGPLAQAQGASERGGLSSFANRKVFGLTNDNKLVSFRVILPQIVQNIGTISGLQSPDTMLVGVDFRVQDGKLYGLGNGGGVYTLDTTNAQATMVNMLTVPLQGTRFGFDFNPAADRLRIVSDQGQNLSHNVNADGTTASQGTLTYTAPPAAPVAALGIAAVAYTNNDLSPNTGTTLFDIDTTLDQVSIQSPPGNGILVAGGKLGLDVDMWAGFDIASQLSDGVTVSNAGYATLMAGGQWGFYQVNLLTGQASLIGFYNAPVADIAIALQ